MELSALPTRKFILKQYRDLQVAEQVVRLVEDTMALALLSVVVDRFKNHASVVNCVISRTCLIAYIL